MPKLPDSGQLDHEWRQLETHFHDFHHYRDEGGPWNLIHNRELDVPVQPELRTLGEGIEFRSPDLEDATNKHKATMQIEPTRIDFRVPGLHQKARDYERDLTLFFRRGWDLQNAHRKIDSKNAEAQVKHGIGFNRKCYKPFKVPEDGEDLKYPFSFEDCFLDGMYWPGGVVDPDGPVWYRYSVPIVESGITKGDQKPTLTASGNLGWMGPHESYDYNLDSRKRIFVVVRDYPSLDPKDMCCLEGCDHPQRYITTYIVPDGQSMKQAEEIETVKSPFKTCSFYAVGGLVMYTERDPHKVYRPLHLPLYELLQWLNYLITVLAMLSRAEAKDNSYIDASGTRPETINALNPSTEAGSAQTFEMPEVGPGEMPILVGPVQRLPRVTSQYLLELIKICREMIEEYRPNRYLSGQANTQASNATANAFIQQVGASGMIYQPLLSEQDAMLERSFHDECHAFAFWTEMCPDDIKPKWVIAVTGQEYTLRGSGKGGEQVYMDAQKAMCDWEVLIITGNKTLAERQAEWSMAKDQYMQGVLTVKDLIRAAGIFDTELQEELLFGDRVESELQPLEDRMVTLLLTRKASIESGYDFGQLLGASNQTPGPAGAANGNTAPTNPNPYPASAARATQPGAMPSMPVESPAGGNLPTIAPGVGVAT